MTINRLILICSILGMGLTLHLWIQKERNFEQGCWGLGVGAPAVDVGCQSPLLAQASEFNGIPVAALGYIFYFFTAALAFSKSIAVGKWRTMFYRSSELLSGAALPIAGYFVYYQVQVGAYCALCLASSTLVAAIGGLHFYRRKKGFSSSDLKTVELSDLAYSCGIICAGGGLIVALLLFVDKIGVQSPKSLASDRPITAQLGPVSSQENTQSSSATTSRSHRFRIAEWIDAETPFRGSPSGVAVALFLDPNCPHCKQTFEYFLRLTGKYKDTARFYLFGLTLWNYSIPQVEALDLAKTSDAYFKFWQLQFLNQTRGGLDFDYLANLGRSAGIDTTDFRERLNGALLPVVALSAKAFSAGISATPTFFVDGVQVNPAENSEAFISDLIEKAASQRVWITAKNAGNSRNSPAVGFNAKFRHAQDLASAKHYSEAVTEYVECFTQSAGNAKFSGARRTFLLEVMNRLATSYPPAQSALEELRDDAEERMSGQLNDMEAVADYAALNSALNADSQTVQFYDNLPKSDTRRSGLAAALYDYFVTSRRYADAAIGRPAVVISSAFESRLKSAANSAHPESDSRIARARAIVDATTAVEVFAGAGESEHAKELCSRILSIDGSSEARKLLSRHLARAGRADLEPSLMVLTGS